MIGAGTIGKRHLQAISEVADAELVAIVDTDPLAEGIANKANARFFLSTRQLLKEMQPHGVIVCTPTEDHLKPVLASIEHNAHVLVEKPIAPSLDQAQQINDHSKRFNKQVLVGHHRNATHGPQTDRGPGTGPGEPAAGRRDEDPLSLDFQTHNYDFDDDFSTRSLASRARCRPWRSTAGSEAWIKQRPTCKRRRGVRPTTVC